MIAALLALAFAVGAPSADSILVLTGGHYLDVRAGVLRPNGAIVIRGGSILAMHAPDERWREPAGARRVPLEGRTVLPGLIDAHVHLTLAGDPEANAAATLRAGFTTVADLGSAAGAGLRLRDEIAAGRTVGPKVIAAGSWIGAKGGVCEFGGATVANAAAAAARAEADIAAGADLLKVCVTGWPGEAVAYPDSVQMPRALLLPVTQAGARVRRPVYAHAIGRAGALLAAGVGARALAHTPIVNSAAAAQLRRAGIYVISTLSTLTAGPEREAIVASFRALRRAGVKIVLGTDAGVLPHGKNADELAALTAAGMTPLEALRAATVDAAELLSSTDIGEIAVGKVADLVVVDGDPLADISAVGRPWMVVRAGRVVGR